MKIQLYVVSAALCATVTVPQAIAQQVRQLQHNPELASHKVTEPTAIANKVELPDLPEYTGQAKLEKGLHYPSNDEVENTYSYVYQAREEPYRIIDWYRTALTMYKWDVESSTTKAILATNPRTGNSVSIYCDNETAAGCKLHLSYSFMQKPSEKSPAIY